MNGLKRVSLCALPLPCAEAGILLYGVLTGGMDTAFSAATPLFILGFLALLVCLFRYWSAYARHFPGEPIPRLPLSELAHPDISKWAFRFWGWFLGNLLLWCGELAFSYIHYTI